MPNPHPLIVHFPIALLTVSFLFDLAGIALKKEHLHRTAWWMLVCGIIGLAGAVTSGILAGQSVAIPAGATGHFEIHEGMAFVAAALSAIVFFWRVSHRTAFPENRRAVYLLLTLAALTAVWIGAWYGGELVYTAGVGIKVIP